MLGNSLCPVGFPTKWEIVIPTIVIPTIVIPVASECLEGGSDFCNMQAPDIVFSSKVVM